GGQFQRMLVARALVQEADLILLDEPFVGIDMVSEQLIMELLKSQRDAGKLILVVHHDLSKVSDYFDQVILLNRRLIAYGETSQVFNRSNLAKTYENQLPLEEVLS
ncbi:metal ABC transporter ATP-binding protein, partial [Streptococcus suis]